MKKTIITTIAAFFLLAAVIAAGLNAIFTVTYVRATFHTYTERGEAAATEIRAALNGYINRSSVFLDLAEVRAVVEANPRFEVVHIEKDYPETIVVEVTERREAFAVAADTGYNVLDETGWVIGAADAPDGYILLEDFSVVYTDGRAGGAVFETFLSVYGAMRARLGEVRANVISARYIVQGERTVYRLQMREGAYIELIDAGSRAAEMADAATEKYLGMSDAERIFCTITAIVRADGTLAVDVAQTP